MLIAEYPTERELLTSLQNETVDKVWLFECQADEIYSELDFMIVDVLDDEYTWEEPKIGVTIQFSNRSNYDSNFTECLENGELKTKSGSHSESPSESTSREELVDTLVDNEYPTFWEPDVRKYFFIFIYCMAMHWRIFIAFVLPPNAMKRLGLSK